MQIDGSRPALLWDVVSSPNNWSRFTKQTHAKGAMTALEQTRMEFWGALSERIEASGSSLSRYKPGKESWQGGSIGTSGIWLNTVTNTRDGWIRVEVYVDGDTALERFETLEQRKEEIENELGFGLTWDRMEGRRAFRIATSRECDITNRDDWPIQHDWIVDMRTALERVIRPLVRELASMPASSWED